MMPGTFVEETATVGPIERLDSGATAFVGMTGWGSAESTQRFVTSFADYQTRYGPCADLRLAGQAIVNHVAYAARSFFQNGGSRLYIIRALGTGARLAHWTASDPAVVLVARAPGGATLEDGHGNFRVTFKIVRRPMTKAHALLQPTGTLIETSNASCLIDAGNEVAALVPLSDDAIVSRVSLRVAVEAPGGFTEINDDLGFDLRHPRSVQAVLGELSEQTLVHLVVSDTVDPASLCALLEAAGSALLTDGSDGDGPPSGADWNAGIERLRELEDVSVIAAPGSSSFPDGIPRSVATALISLADDPASYCFAVLDAPSAISPSGVIEYAQVFDTKNAALYYPWVVAADVAGAPIALPPSGFVCGVYSRSDNERGVWKAPSDEVLSSSIGLAATLTSQDQEVLNPIGVNSIRAFPERGIRVFGARTLSSDPEWKYVSQRRYFQHLHRSIERGVAWAVFEQSEPALWATLTTSVSNFLMQEWQSGALIGAKVSDAFFVRCDRSIMTQDNYDNGRVIILIGLALVKPAEFVNLRIDIPARGKLA